MDLLGILQWILPWIFSRSLKGTGEPQEIHRTIHTKSHALRRKIHHGKASAEGQSRHVPVNAELRKK